MSRAPTVIGIERFCKPCKHFWYYKDSTSVMFEFIQAVAQRNKTNLYYVTYNFVLDLPSPFCKPESRIIMSDE